MTGCNMAVDIGVYGAFFIGWGFGAVVGVVAGAMATYIIMRREATA